VGAAETRALGERKVVSILFADLVGSTSLGDGEDPERTRALLERFYVAMTEVLEAAEGTIEKFAGDAVLTVFGAPVAQEDHAERALHASLAMRARLAADFPGLELRIGVNTGEVLVGAPRAGSAFVSGDSVNVAARLEQNADAGQILAGARTVAAVGAAFEFAPPFEVAAKGKRGGVLAFELVEAVARTRPRGLTSLGSTFVGRTAELEQIRAAWRRLSEKRESSLLVLIGDAGIGKTSLVERALGWLGAQAPKPVVRSGRCLAYGQG
jgi:class 3 adenylate cyclase